ncbi:hypothetical protein [Dactylosporangium sp. NPDC048998]|uniref:hypothetical protein n=1 Tax=Dactylosporangium sp. NPDC048998 TaxID=3363976 RepID=UPI003713846F
MTVSAAAHHADRDTAADTTPDGRVTATAPPDTAAGHPAAAGAGPSVQDHAGACTARDGRTAGQEDWPSSPFACVDAAFAALTCDPDPLCIDLSHLDPALGLPSGPVNVAELRTWLARHRRNWVGLDAVWRELITRARLHGPAWVVTATALALPALVRHAAALVAGGWRGDPDDVDAEVLAGFLAALRDHVDVAKPAPYASLCRAAQRAGHRLVAQQRDVLLVDDLDAVAAGPRTPQRPWGHPDLLVRRAVELGLLDEADEQPYIDTRLGRRAIEPIAVRLGVTVDALRMRLRRVDARLARALADGVLTGTVSPQAQQALAWQAEQRRLARTAQVATATATTTAPARLAAA